MAGAGGAAAAAGAATAWAERLGGGWSLSDLPKVMMYRGIACVRTTRGVGASARCAQARCSRHLPHARLPHPFPITCERRQEEVSGSSGLDLVCVPTVLIHPQARARAQAHTHSLASKLSSSPTHPTAPPTHTHKRTRAHTNSQAPAHYRHKQQHTRLRKHLCCLGAHNNLPRKTKVANSAMPRGRL